jgi:hypothetical protein
VSKRLACLADVRGHRQGWSQYELLHLYRTAKVLEDAGFCLETDSGVTDEGDPWFVLCHVGFEEAIVHFARIGGMYIVCFDFQDRSLSGRSFPDLIDRFLQRYRGAERQSSPDRYRHLRAAKQPALAP